MRLGYFRRDIQAEAQALLARSDFAPCERKKQAVHRCGWNRITPVAHRKLETVFRRSGDAHFAFGSIGQRIAEQIGKELGQPRMIDGDRPRNLQINRDNGLRMGAL